MNTANSPIDVHELIRRHSPGCALERQFYTDPRIFESDMDRILLRHWFCAANVASVPRPRDFVLVDLGAMETRRTSTSDP